MAGPQTLGRYEIERVLGKGAMGVVYEALDPKLHRKVAIKTILINQLDEETAKDFSMRFVREAHAVARLNHPNIVQVYDFGEEGEVAYLVMEFIRGKELKSVLASGSTFDRKESARIMSELLDALDFAHQQGVVHRDIKPANVMLDTQSRVKLTDFGVARVTDADRTNAERTQAGTMVGTPAYMSPEQIQGHRVDGRSDIFSAGIILYQFLTGQKPFTGDGAWTVAKKIIQDDPPMPSSLNVAVSPQLDRVVAKALAKLPEDRYQSAREFAGALRSAVEGKAGVASSAEPTVVVRREPETPTAPGSGEMELEFWRSIKDSDDPNDFELYLKQFPRGVYASLAGRRVARLRGLPVEGGAEASNTRQPARTETTGSLGRLAREPGPPAKRADEGTAVEKTLKLPGSRVLAPELEAEVRPAPGGKRSSIWVPAVLGLLAAAGVAAYFATRPGVQPPAPATPGVEAAGKIKEDEALAKREAEAKARQEAQEKAQREAELQARREAEAKARRAEEAKSRREAELKAQREQAQREAESRAKAEAELQAQRDAKAKAQREAQAQAKREALLKEQRDAELKARRETEARAKREAEARAQAEARAKLAAETSLWNSIKNSKNTADYQKYLDQYPRGKFADPARKRIAALEKARLDEAKRVEAEKAKADRQKRAEEEQAQAVTQEAEAARRKAAAEKNRATIVPPTF